MKNERLEQAHALLVELSEYDPYYEHEYGGWKCMFCQEYVRDGHDKHCVLVRVSEFLKDKE